MKKAQLIAAASALMIAFGFFACQQPTDNTANIPQAEYSISFNADGGAFFDGNSIFTVKDTQQRIIGADFPA
jgi:hypothetical protein